ncbi:hypothetical protein D3C75_916790 [compost metagenome]
MEIVGTIQFLHQTVKRIILIFIGFNQLFFHLMQIFLKRQIAAGQEADRQRVDEHSHYIFQALMMPSRCWHAYDDILASRQLGQ